MFCRYCYTELAADGTHCQRCGRAFVAGDSKTFLQRPFPPARRIIQHLILTSIVGIGVALVVAFFQSVAASGH